jgi:hypothetical protein
MDRSGGFGSITGSALGHDFYWYVMGATSGGKPFSSEPLSGSSEPARAYGDSDSKGDDDIDRDAEPAPGRHRPAGIFDIPLAARFVVWNCLKLGWTAARFNEFDTRHEVRGQGRMARHGRTERIGKKYQWISWQTMLAFLADNYRMTPEPFTGDRQYDTPHQIGYIEVFDPSRWLHADARPRAASNGDFWNVPSLPRWPTTSDDDLRHWGASPSFDLAPLDVLNHIPKLPHSWGDGPWLRVMGEHVWRAPKAPGAWGLNQERDADIWWQMVPALVESARLPELLSALDRPQTRAKLTQLGRIDLDSDRDAQLADWPGLRGPFDRGLEAGEHTHDAWLPVPWMHFAGECGSSDRTEEDGPVVMPWPRLFRTWNLTLDLQRGIVRRGEDVLFGLAGWVLHEDALFARRDLLMTILAEHSQTLIWWIRGERRAFVRDIGTSRAHTKAWIDTHGVAYLAADARVQVAWLSREVRKDDSTKQA